MWKTQDRLEGLYHINLTTGTAQGDVHFFIKVMGLRLVKRTLLYDGAEPIYHLYFGNELSNPGTLTTTFPMRRLGRKGREGLARSRPSPTPHQRGRWTGGLSTSKRTRSTPRAKSASVKIF